MRRRSRSWILGVDMGATSVKLAAIDARGRPRVRRSLPTRRFRAARSLIAAIVRELRAVAEELPGGWRSVRGIGIGAPGQIDSARGIVHYFINIRGWREVPLARLIRRATGVPVFVDNDVNVMALGELRYGAGRGCRHALAITLGTGVGGGLIIDGRLYRGASGSAGEIGHVTINEGGPACPCGSRGCMEVYVGNRALERRARALFGRRVRLEEVSRLARAGHRAARRLWEEAGGHLGTALAAHVNVCNPQRIIIGGGVAQAGPVLLRAIRRAIDARAMSTPARAARLLRAQLGTDAGVIGAAVLVRESLEGKLG